MAREHNLTLNTLNVNLGGGVICLWFVILGGYFVVEDRQDTN